MPITLVDRTYLDAFGNSLTFYKANAGDLQRVNFTIKESISVTTGTTIVLSLDPINNIVTWIGGSFEDEGFRVGDLVTFTIYASGGSVITTWTTLVTSVNGNLLDVNSIPQWYDQTAGEILMIGVTSRNREGLKLSLNHVQNGTTGNALSLIDAEATQCTFDLTGSSPFTGVKVSKQSGQFDYTADLSLISSVGVYNTYSLTIDVIQSGIYDSTWFSSNNCLKLYVELAWQSLLGEPYANTKTIISEDANTGWFDEPYNLDVLDATLIQGITDIYFDQPTTAQVVVDCAALDYAFGFSYVPQDDTYYKSKFDNQSTLSGILPSAVFSIGGTVSGATLPNGGYMEITLVNAVQVGTIWTFDLTFTPSTGFANFMLNKAEVDRLFYVWVKIGNLNLLAFNNLLSENVPVGGPITMLAEDFTDHAQNVTTGTGIETTYEANIEDDLGFYGAFRIPENENCESFTAILQAFNPVTNESFDLQTAFFSFASIPMVAGKYVLNESVPLFTSFDSNSAKISSIFKLNSSYDTTGEYGVDIFFPFLYRWEYWLQQLNADADFYPNQQTKNYVPYGTTTPWTLRVRLELIKEGLLFFNNNDIVIKDYDSDPTIDQTIDLFVESTNQNVNVIVEGELMRVECTHTLNDGTFWVPLSQWGMITVEPFENSPRWWCSTAVPFDGNGLNPLTPLTGNYCDVSYPNFNQVKLTCYFNPSKINLQNGVKFTSKIKGCTTSIRPKFKFTTYGKIKETTSGGLKEMS